MGKISLVTVAIIILLAGCAPNFQKQEEVVQENDDSKGKAIIPKYNISDEYYRTILPFEASEARGLVVNNINTRYDISEFETGLMRVAQNTFSPDKYFFQEGQFLKRETVQLWLNRKYTAAQLKEKKLSEAQNLGLNPLIEGTETQENNTKYPMYLAHILEHDYLVKGDDDTIGLGGVVIGLALNSIHYYQTEQYGATYDKEIARSELEIEGKKIAEEVVKRLRKMEGLKDIPITIALFEQQSRSSVVPGNFFAYSNVEKGSTSLSKWENINEKYVLFPSTDANNNHKDDVTPFLNFKQDVEKYFPNFNGVVGKAFYVDNQLQELNIEIPIQFYGKTESVGFTQFVTGKVMELFPDYITTQISIRSVNGPEALIVRKANEDEPFVHIYQ